jgi:hypothetical protein
MEQLCSSSRRVKKVSKVIDIAESRVETRRAASPKAPDHCRVTKKWQDASLSLRLTPVSAGVAPTTERADAIRTPSC